ncbi:MAG: uroporphyrinogen decarboxylase family protein [Promethearchaeota archaeon]
MVLSKRERVFLTLELDGEPDLIPIHVSGFEQTNTAYQYFLKSKEYENNKTIIKNNYSQITNNWAGDITELRFWNADCSAMDPFEEKLITKRTKNLNDFPNCEMNPLNGKIYMMKPQVETGLMYRWYVNGYFKTREKLLSYWEEYGKPIEYINNNINYSPKVWEDYVNSLSPYVYPMARLGIAMHEALFEGMTIARVAYYMRKDPQFIHSVMKEYLKVNIELIKRLGEAGVDIIFYYDDLGLKGRSIFSLKHFREFILPYYKKIYQECNKRSIFIVQHSCGYIDELLPDMVKAGLDCIEALEPTAGVNLSKLKETLGDKIVFMGGMDSSRVLNFGTPYEIEEEVKRCIKAAGNGGGYFAGPSHNILNPSWDNVLAFRNALLKYRKYPLRI